MCLGKPSLKKKMTFVISGLTPPPILKKDDKLFFIYFSSTRPYFGHFWKKNIFVLVKIFKIYKIPAKMPANG